MANAPRIMHATQWLQLQHEQVVQDLIELANLNSGSDNLPGLHRVADWLANWFGLSAAFRRIELPPRSEIDSTGQLIDLATGPALRWDYRPGADRRILLAIHYDTVFGAQHPFQSCRQESDGRLRGPGVADAKGGIVVLRTALRALEEFELLNDCGWTVLLNPDEELGSPHSAGLLSRIAEEFDFGLLFEPAYPGGELVSQRKGSGNFTIVVRGAAAHAGRHFDEGHNAVAALCELLSGLHHLNAQERDCTVNIGYVQGGGPVNIVPDLAIGKLNVRMQDPEHASWFEGQLQSRVDALQCTPGFQCMRIGRITSPPKLITPPMQALMEAVAVAHVDAGLTPVQWVSTGGVCDGNKLAAAGLPNVDTLGPVGGGLHSDQEWVRTASIIEKANVVMHLLSRYAASQQRYRAGSPASKLD